MILRAEAIVRTFEIGSDRCRVLDDVSLEIEKGSLIMLMGSSGSGKTTLLNILGALDRPDSGRVLYHDICLTDMSDSERDRLRRESFGYVFQSGDLIPVMSAGENVELGLRAAGVAMRRKELVEEALALVGMNDRITHMPSEMSGGEKQRVAIARALVHSPEIIFADEPTGALDTANGIKVVKLFRQLIEERGLTVIMSTHDTGLMDMADRVIRL